MVAWRCQSGCRGVASNRFGGTSSTSSSSRLNKHQKEKVQQFMNITDSRCDDRFPPLACLPGSERAAISTLKHSDWNLELAFEIFYSGGPPEPSHFLQPSRPSTDPSRIEALYIKYKDPHQDIILVDGVSKLCEDLQVEPSDIVMLLLSHRMQAATMCEYTKQEFATGLRSLGVDSVEGLRNALPGLRAELADENKFRDVYNYAFAWSKEKGQKSLALDTALGMWRLIFEHRKWPLTEHWCRFLETRHNKAISRDTWNQLWDFTKITDLSFKNYDDKGAWPYLIDDFVGYLREAGVVPSESKGTAAA